MYICWLVHLVLWQKSFIADLGDIGSVLREFDTVLCNNAVPDNLLGLVDASSLLWRLNVMGIDPGEERWERVINGFSKLLETHALTWLVCVMWVVELIGISCEMHPIFTPRYDAHMMMSLAHGKVSETSARLAIAEQALKVTGTMSPLLSSYIVTCPQALGDYSITNLSADCKIADTVGLPRCLEAGAYSFLLLPFPCMVCSLVFTCVQPCWHLGRRNMMR